MDGNAPGYGWIKWPAAAGVRLCQRVRRRAANEKSIQSLASWPPVTGPLVY